MKRIYMIAVAVLCASFAALAQSTESNLCYNYDFSSEKGHFDGWNLDFDWTGNSHWQGNHLHASYLAVYLGKKNVLKMEVPKHFEAKVETPLIPYAAGERYRCSFDIYVDGFNMKMRFNGYNFKPGIRPYENPALSDLRPVYRTEQMDVKRGSWKTVSMDFPNNTQISATAYSHLKKTRYISVLTYVPGFTYGAGNFYIANMRITKLPGTVKVGK